MLTLFSIGFCRGISTSPRGYQSARKRLFALASFESQVGLAWLHRFWFALNLWHKRDRYHVARNFCGFLFLRFFQRSAEKQ